MKRKQLVFAATTFFIISVAGALIRRSTPTAETITNACAPGRSVTLKRANPPDIFLVTVDTLRADYLGIFGGEDVKTPSIDALGARGMVFRQATTPFPRTTPALASLLTGLRPRNHGSREVFDDLKNGETISEILCRGGYTTIAVSANSAASHHQNLDKGFSTFVLYKGARAEDVTDLALELAEGATAARPLFLWVHYIDPHFTYDPPPDRHPDIEDTRCEDLMRKIDLGLLERSQLYDNYQNLSEEALPSCKVLYGAEIRYADCHIGRLLDGLKEIRGGRDLTVFTSDHGENLGEHALYYEHGASPHDASVRVPLILAGAGIEVGEDIGVARLEDLMPTILDMIEMPRNERPPTDGSSLAGRLSSDFPRTRQPEVAFIHGGRALHAKMSRYPLSGRETRTQCINGPRYSACWDPGGAPSLFDRTVDDARENDLADQEPEVLETLMSAGKAWRFDNAFPIAVRTPRFKLVAFPSLETGEREHRLFDLENDSDETRDVSALYPNTATRLRRALDSWFGSAAKRATSSPKTLGTEELEQLRHLGYID